MKKTFTHILKHGLMALALLLPATASAQEIGELEGYVNVFVRLKAAVSGTGRVQAYGPDKKPAAAYFETWDFKATLPVASALQIVYFNAKAQPAKDYMFAGWYFDTDGNGEFDINADEFNNSFQTSLLAMSIGMLGLSDDDVYDTESEAKAATQPTAPQLTVFAFFTNGATAMVDYQMDDMGTVEISKPINSPGDEITVTAVPNEGYKFEYWKTAYGSQWRLEQPNTAVSHDPVYTFTVQGGEHLYAYFSDEEAPVIEFPEEGGWKALAFDATWILHEQADAYSYLPSLTDSYGGYDLITNEQGQSYFDTTDTLGIYDTTVHYPFGNVPTLIYGRGTVRFVQKSVGVNYDREGNLLRWSGSRGTTITDKNNAIGYHVYVFNEDKSAFLRIGTTDLYAQDDAPQSITVPANTCYICVEGITIADPETDYIPSVIGMSPEDYDNALAGVQTLVAQPRDRGAVYDLQGRKMNSATPLRRGLYIKDGCTFIVNK